MSSFDKFERMAEQAKIRRLTAADYPDDPEAIAEQEAIAQALTESQHAAQSDCEPGTVDVTIDALAAAIAAEEHRQGRPYLAEPEHCDGCADVDVAWERATCKHGRRIDIRSLEDPYEHWYCDDCGHTWRGDPVPTVPPPPPLRDDPELVEWWPK